MGAVSVPIFFAFPRGKNLLSGDFLNENLLAVLDLEDEGRFVGGNAILHVPIEHDSVESLDVLEVVSNGLALGLQLARASRSLCRFDGRFDHVHGVVVVGGEARGLIALVIRRIGGLEGVPAGICEVRVDVVVDLNAVDVLAARRVQLGSIRAAEHEEVIHVLPAAALELFDELGSCGGVTHEHDSVGFLGEGFHDEGSEGDRVGRYVNLVEDGVAEIGQTLHVSVGHSGPRSVRLDELNDLLHGRELLRPSGDQGPEPVLRGREPGNCPREELLRVLEGGTRRDGHHAIFNRNRHCRVDDGLGNRSEGDQGILHEPSHLGGAFLRIEGSVDADDLDGLAENSTGVVDFLGGALSAPLKVFADAGDGAVESSGTEPSIPSAQAANIQQWI